MSGEGWADTVIVVPCYNEETRLDVSAFRDFVALGLCDLLLVDDGSTDRTRHVLEELAADSDGRIHTLGLDDNGGKAEAVRRGLLEAIARGAKVVGFLDADLSTPFSEMKHLLEEHARSGAAVVLGARVALLGRDIDRKAWRHYLGRVFATFASNILDLTVYDTQCGAKVFTVSDGLQEALADPFLSRWAFDVELIGRLMTGGPDLAPLDVTQFLEVPLREWRDVGGSKLSVPQMSLVLGDLARIARDIRRRKRER
jgi:glycosyltransferase involved in cell wall biosynthesis